MVADFGACDCLATGTVVKKDGFFDRFTVNFSLLLTAVPSFWLAALFILFFSVKLGVLPISGYAQPENWVLPIAVTVLTGMGGDAPYH